MKESLFTRLAGAHPRLLAIKLDGASKEDFAWGLRLAFMTYGIAGGQGAYEALEKKTGGCIRGTISNSPNVSQELLVRAMGDPDYNSQKAEKFTVLKRRAEKARKVLADPKFAEVWVISASDTDIRVAHSCVDEGDIADLYGVMLQCALEMRKG
jgi:aspartate/methionine/tyrosine aminotransferase